MSRTDSTPVRRTLLRRAFLLALVPAVLLAAQLAKADVVRVPTEDGGTWTITITPAERIVAALDEPTAPLPESEELAPTADPGFYPAPAAQADSTPQGEESLVPMPPSPAESIDTLPALPAKTQNAETTTSYEYSNHGVVITPQVHQPSQADAYRRIYESIPFSRTEYLANPSYRHDTAMEMLTGIPRQSAGQGNYVPQLNEPTRKSPLFMYNRYGGIGPYYGSGGVSSYHSGFGFGYGYIPQYAPAFRYFLPLEDLY